MSAIGDELREFVKTKERYLYSASLFELLGLADRIRKLAKNGASNGTD